MTYYYYFVKGIRTRIERFITPMRGSLFVELTPEQREFYIANPSATAQEVENCQLTPPYTPPEEDVQEHIEHKVKDLRAACLATIAVGIPEYAMANAVLAGSSVLYSGDKFYTTLEAKAVMKQFMDESAHAMNIFKAYKAKMEMAVTNAAVDELYDEAIGKL
jgi:hypothetical protein